jgi:hypothetical protein
LRKRASRSSRNEPEDHLGESLCTQVRLSTGLTLSVRIKSRECRIPIKRVGERRGRTSRKGLLRRGFNSGVPKISQHRMESCRKFVNGSRWHGGHGAVSNQLKEPRLGHRTAFHEAARALNYWRRAGDGPARARGRDTRHVEKVCVGRVGRDLFREQRGALRRSPSFPCGALCVGRGKRKEDDEDEDEEGVGGRARPTVRTRTRHAVDSRNATRYGRRVT